MIGEMGSFSGGVGNEEEKEKEREELEELKEKEEVKEKEEPREVEEAVGEVVVKRVLWWRGVLVAAVVLAVIAGGVYWFWFARRLTAEQVLDRLVQAYRQAQDFAESTTVIQVTKMGTMETKSEMSTKLFYRRPNKIYYEADGGLMGSTFVSDGKDLYTYMALMKKCIREPAPGKVSEISMLKMKEFMDGGIDELTLLEGEDPRKEMEEFKLLGTKRADGVRAYVLQLSFRPKEQVFGKMKVDQKLWVGRL